MTEAGKLRPLLSTDWKPATEVTHDAEALGLTVDQIRAARKALGVTREMGGVARRDGRWWWRLPNGECPTCGNPWRGSWALHGHDGDYWAGSRPSSPVIPDDDPAIALDDEPASTAFATGTVPGLEPVEPPRCAVCGRASAMDRGAPCPFWSNGRRCAGVVR